MFCDMGKFLQCSQRWHFNILLSFKVSINRGQKRDVCRDIRSGQYYLVGQSWQLDQCTTCYCGKSGKAACAVQMCERDPKCKDLLHDNSQCCPKCKDENGKQFTDLLNWCYSFSKIIICISICMNTSAIMDLHCKWYLKFL